MPNTNYYHCHTPTCIIATYQLLSLPHTNYYHCHTPTIIIAKHQPLSLPQANYYHCHRPTIIIATYQLLSLPQANYYHCHIPTIICWIDERSHDSWLQMWGLRAATSESISQCSNFSVSLASNFMTAQRRPIDCESRYKYNYLNTHVFCPNFIYRSRTVPNLYQHR